MTSEDMKYEIQARIELLPGLNKGDLEDEEMNFYLNAAQIKVVENLYAQGLTQLLTELYRTTKISGSIDDYINGITNIKGWSLDSIPDYMFFIDAAFENIVNTEYLPCTLIDKKDAMTFAKTSKNKVWFEYPKIFITDTKILVIVDSNSDVPTNTSILEITFIKKPSLIDVANTSGGNCELRAMLHNDVIAEAIKQITNEKRLKPNAEGTE